MEILIKILQLLFSLSILVFIHESGHFIMAKIFKVRVEKFYIFFNPWFSLFKFKKGETEYGVGWIPLGGYVKISGMIDESLDLDQMGEEPKSYEFRSKPDWQRLFIMIGGVLMNLFFAFFLYIIILFTWGETYLPVENIKYGVVPDSVFIKAGVQTGDIIVSLDDVKVENFYAIVGDILLGDYKTMQVIRNGELVNIELTGQLEKDLLIMSSKSFKFSMPLIPRFLYDGSIKEFVENSPAKMAGLRDSGDRIVEINGKEFTFYDEFSNMVKSSKNSLLEARVLRGTDTLTFNIPIGEDGLMGIIPSITGFEHAVKYYSFIEAIPAGINKGVSQLKDYIRQFKLFKNPEAFKSLGGFVSIGNIFEGFWHWPSFWNMTALLSVILAVMNLLPIPGLDGGHVIFILYEMITRRKPSDKFMENAQISGMIIILFLLLVANGNDIIKLFN